jgi:diguanylate cyclase (GGDEF)-like protein
MEANMDELRSRLYALAGTQADNDLGHEVQALAGLADRLAGALANEQGRRQRDQAQLEALLETIYRIAAFDFDCKAPVQGNGLIDAVALSVNMLAEEFDAAQRALLEQKERFEKLALTDELTGLDNRRHFYALLEAEFKRSLRHQLPLSVLMVDLDHFKQINDGYGHCAGDRVLETFAELLKKSLRAEDVIGRVGGEEFCVMLPSVGLSGAFVAAQNLRGAVENAQFSVGGRTIPVTVSIGVSERAPSFPDVVDMIRSADNALYRAKAKGRNRVEMAEGER